MLDYDIHPPTNEFLDSLSSHYFLHRILQPSTVTSNSKTLIDNIFSNKVVLNIISRTGSISEHLPQFRLAPDIFLNFSYPTSNKYERHWSRFDQEDFVLDYFSVDWDNLLLSSNMTFLEKCESLTDTYAPLKKF